MSYNFAVRGATKSEVMRQIAVELDHVASQQPVHEKDRDAARDTAEALVHVLWFDPLKDVRVTVSGSITESSPGGITQVSIQVAAAVVDKEVPQTHPV